MMKNLSKKSAQNISATTEIQQSPTPQADMIAKGVATGIVVSTILHAGRGIATAVVRNPLLIFGLGMAAGYFTYKYRKEITSVSRQAANQSRAFVLRQKEQLQHLVQEEAEKVELPKNLH